MNYDNDKELSRKGVCRKRGKEEKWNVFLLNFINTYVEWKPNKKTKTTNICMGKN